MKKWNKEEIEFLKKYGSVLLIKDLSIILKRTKCAVANKRKDLKIRLSPDYNYYLGRSRSFDKSKNNDLIININDLDNNEFQVLFGCLLGDGSIKRKQGCSHFIFACSHSYKQKEYVLWKKDFFSKFFATYNESINKDDDSKSYSLFFTRSSPLFTQLRRKFYTKEKFGTKDILPLSILNNLDLLGLLIWFLDDGYSGKRKTGETLSPTISVKGYPSKELNNFCEMFNKKYNLNLFVRYAKHRNGMNKTIAMPAKDRDFLLPIWKKYIKELKIPKCMYYKLNYSEG